MTQCTAIRFRSILKSHADKLKGTVIVGEDHWAIKHRCNNKSSKTLYRNGYEFAVCGSHNNENACVVGHLNKGETKTVAQLDDTTTVNLTTGETTEQLSLIEEEPRDLIIEFPRTISLVAVKENGFKVEGGVKKFYWYRKGRMLVDNDVFLTMLVQKHFATHRNSKYVVITTMGKVVCFKRDLTFATMDNCIVQKSRFVA